MRDIIDIAANRWGERTAFRYKIKDKTEDKTYAQLKADSERFGRMLAGCGMQQAHVAVLGPTSYEWIVCYFGTTNAGGVAVPLDVQLSADTLCELIERADVQVLVYDKARDDVAMLAKEKCPQLKVIIAMQETTKAEGVSDYANMLKQYGDNEGEQHRMTLDPDKMCAILFTSGTTGKSKGVMLSHRNLTENATCLDMGIPEGMVSLTILPVHHAYCFTMDILKGLYIGTTICINDSILRVAKNMKLFQPDIMLVVPMILESIYHKLKEVPKNIPKELAAKEVFGGRLKTICSGGAYMPPEMLDFFAQYGIKILQGYGMTECSPVISTSYGTCIRKGSVGKIMPNCQVKVVDGELWVKGSSVMLGYYHMPQQTEEALEGEWLKTGDLGYVDEDGYLFLTGRKKNLIILKNGENVSPEELENELSMEPLVKEILVREKESVIEAEIYPDMELVGKQQIADIRESLQAVIDSFNATKPLYKRIYSLVVRDSEFPKTASGKIKR